MTTTERGYGWKHQQARTRALTALADNPGQPCHHCGQPMWPWQNLHLDHTDDRTNYRGLAHAECNTSDGGRRHGTQPERRYPAGW